LHSSHHTDSAEIHHLADEAATLALGKEIGEILNPGLIIFLQGNLGAGKTTLARGILRGQGYGGRVKSPTYNLVEHYKNSRLYLYHFDFYRFNEPMEWEDTGFREYFNADSVCLIEWPEKAHGLLPPPDLQIFLGISETGRNIRIQAGTEAGRQCLKHWRAPAYLR